MMVERYTIPDGPGGVIGIFKGNEPLYTRAFGYANVEARKLNTPETLFDIASCSKQFTAAAVIEMSNKGMIDLNEPIQKYFPEFTVEDSIPIRSLLTHSSGISDYSEMLLLARGKSEVSTYSKSEILQTIFSQPDLSFTPLHDDNYSNSNYVLLAELVERVSGQSFEDFITQTVLGDLNMNSSEFHFPGTHWANSLPIATGYPMRKQGQSQFINDAAKGINHFPQENNDLILGSSGIQANIYGLAKWMSSLKNKRTGEELLIRQLIEKDTLTNGNLTEYARGVQVGRIPDGYSYIEHTGRNNFTSVMLWWPDFDISMIALMNTQEIWAQDLTNEICMDIIYSFPEPQQLFGEIAIEEKTIIESTPTPNYTGAKTKVNLDPNEMERFAGIYPADAPVGNRKPPSGGVGVNKIVYKDGRLTGIRYDGLSINLIPVSNSVLAMEGVPIEFHFVDLKSDQPGFYMVEQGQPENDQLFRRLKPESQEEKSTYIGKYTSAELPNSIPIEIKLIDNRLHMQWGVDQNITELYPIENKRLTTYLSKDGVGMQCNLVLMKNEEGEITGFKYDGHRVWNLEFDKI